VVAVNHNAASATDTSGTATESFAPETGWATEELDTLTPLAGKRARVYVDMRWVPVL
jgi:hypothetical protein